jgi:hypothetical protein
VADQGASRRSHARHAAAEFCRLATAARRGRPRVDTTRARPRARGMGECGRAGPASASGPEVRPRPASAPFSLFYFFFLNFFSQTLSKFLWTTLNSFSPFSPKMKIVPKQKPYNFVLSRIHKFQIDFEIQLKLVIGF